jgi:UDP-N-acetyl-D-mannosaminuronic acid dehydrogenase
MGLAFKPDIDDLRESPAKYITSRIISEANTDVLVAEPNIKSHKTFNLAPYREAYKKADIVVWLVRHKEFVNMPVAAGKIELDFCGIRK